MIILALDTTTDLASVAVRKDGKTQAEETIRTSDGHSYLIFQMVKETLKKAGVLLTDVDCFASAIGPGSFTGVRICLTAVKGLADALGKPVAGISNLRALATFGTAPLRNPIVDARRGQIYTAIYDSTLKLVSDEIVVATDEWKPEFDVEVIRNNLPLAPAIAMCAEQDGPAKWVDPAILDAQYVRQSDAQAFWVDLGAKMRSEGHA